MSELNTITIDNKLDMSYDFYIKHNMCALEWELKGMIKKNKLIIKLDRGKRHPLIRKISHVSICNC